MLSLARLVLFEGSLAAIRNVPDELRICSLLPNHVWFKTRHVQCALARLELKESGSLRLIHVR